MGIEYTLWESMAEFAIDIQSILAHGWRIVGIAPGEEKFDVNDSLIFDKCGEKFIATSKADIAKFCERIADERYQIEVAEHEYVSYRGFRSVVVNNWPKGLSAQFYHERKFIYGSYYYCMICVGKNYDDLLLDFKKIVDEYLATLSVADYFTWGVSGHEQ